jgi:ribosome biogenesis protein ENP2
MEAQRASRISSTKKTPKINAELASKLSNKKTPSSTLEDSRFADLFKDEEFQVDKTSNEYKLHHPTESKKIDFSSFEPIKEDAQESSAFDSSSSDDESVSGPRWYERA